MQSVLNKLAQINKGRSRTKRSLSKGRNVKLSVMDDLDSALAQIRHNSLSLGSYYAYERFEEIEDKILDFKFEISKEVDNQIVNSEVINPDDAFYDVIEAMTSLERSADELGIDVNSIESYAEATKLYEEYSTMYDDYRKAYQKVVDTAGFLAQF